MPVRPHPRAVNDDVNLQGSDACLALSSAFDRWLVGLFDQTIGTHSGAALIAIGGYGRQELAPGSDLDLLLLIDRSTPSDIADPLWYPIWDEGIKLGHAVRTVTDTIALAREDLATATALLSARLLCGNDALFAELHKASQHLWASEGAKMVQRLAEATRERHEQFGDIAYDLEPDLKEGRGGLRDVHALRWGFRALGRQFEDVEAELRPHYEQLLRARVALHRLGATSNRLLLQDQDEVANHLNESDADALMAVLAASARALSWRSDEFWFDVENGPSVTRFRRTPRPSWIDDDFELNLGRIEVISGATPTEMSILTAARIAAVPGRRLSRATLDWLRAAPPLGEPWPTQARTEFIALLATGRDAITVIESLDQFGLWLRLIPEWAPNSSRPQRNAYHHFTVDRHLLETVAIASTLTGSVSRPDLLLMGALLHDIGKGYPGDHSVVGIDLAASVCHRMGFSTEDIQIIAFLVEHHLLLADSATRRDLEDPSTIRTVAAIVEDPVRLELLAALTEADSLATGPSAWSTWKSGLVYSLADRVSHVLRGGTVEDVTAGETIRPASETLLTRAKADGIAIAAEGNAITIASKDHVGLFHKVAGVLALNGLDIIDATVHTKEAMAILEFHVISAFSREVPWAKVERDLLRSFTGRFAFEPRLAERARSYRRKPTSARGIEPMVKIVEDGSDDATIVEVYGPDSVGLLFRLTRALADLDCNVFKAKVTTIGGDVIDAFYVRGIDGAKITDPADHQELTSALLYALLSIPSA